MSDGRGNVELASVLDVESDIDGGEDSGVPLLLLDTPGLVGVLSCECKVVDGDALEQRELDGVSADTDLLDLLEVDSHGRDELVDCVDKDLVRDIGTHVDAEREVVHDVGTGQGVAFCDGGRDDLPGLQLYGVSPRTTGSDIEGYSITHCFFLLIQPNKDFFSSFG